MSAVLLLLSCSVSKYCVWFLRVYGTCPGHGTIIGNVAMEHGLFVCSGSAYWILNPSRGNCTLYTHNLETKLCNWRSQEGMWERLERTHCCGAPLCIVLQRARKRLNVVNMVGWTKVSAPAELSCVGSWAAGVIRDAVVHVHCIQLCVYLLECSGVRIWGMLCGGGCWEHTFLLYFFMWMWMHTFIRTYVHLCVGGGRSCVGVGRRCVWAVA